MSTITGAAIDDELKVRPVPPPGQIVGVIPARWGSSRLPGKVLEPVNGRPLLEWVITACRGSRRVGQWLVATEDERIASLAERLHVRAVMTPTALRTGSDRVHFATRDSDAAWILNIQADELFFDPRLVDDLVSSMAADRRCAVATLARPIAQEAAGNANIVKVVYDRYRRALYFSRSAIPYRRVADGDSTDAGRRPWHAHIGVYAYTQSVLRQFANWRQTPLEVYESLEQLRLLEHGVRIHVGRTGVSSWRIDTAEDIEAAEAEIERMRAQPQGRRQRGR